MQKFAEFITEKLTKTEQGLVDQARKAHNNRISVTSTIKMGGRNAGDREKKAFHSLVKKGHLIHEPEHSSHETELTKDGTRRSVHYSTVVGRLNPSSPHAKEPVKEEKKMKIGVPDPKRLACKACGKPMRKGAFCKDCCKKVDANPEHYGQTIQK